VKLKDATMNNLHPIMAMALSGFAPPTDVDTRWLAFCESELRNARRQYDSKPDWNADKKTWADAIVRIQQDIDELKAGVQRDDLSSVKNWRMPAWGYSGT
jgi:hypothetical protein